MVQGGMSCVKYLMFVFNFVFVVCGIALIVVGAVVQNQNFTRFLESKYLTAPTILIIVGVIIFLLAFLGCCGAIRENHCMVLSFGILLFLIFIVEIAGGITAYVNRNQVEGILKDGMNSTLQQNTTDARKVWNEIEKNWKCCGVDYYTDYPKNDEYLPPSCCNPEHTGTCTGNSKDVYKKGCFKEMYDNVKHMIGLAGAVAIGIAVVELIGVMFSWCLAAAIKKEYR